MVPVYKTDSKDLALFLKEAGLSQYKSRVYLALMNLGEASVAEINRASKVPLPKIYEVVNELSDEGLIKLCAHRPKRYKIIHPGNFFDRVIKSEELQLEQLKKEMPEVLRIFRRTQKEVKEELRIIKGKAEVFNELIKILKNSQKSYDAVIRLRTYHNPLMPLFRKKIKKNFRARIVGPLTRKAIAREYLKNGFQVRLSDQLEVFILFSIWDKKILTLNLSDEPENYTTVITHSPELVKKFYELFIYHWERGKPLVNNERGK